MDIAADRTVDTAPSMADTGTAEADPEAPGPADTATARRARAARLALGLTTLSAAAWTAKSLAIGAAGGLGLSPAEGPLFFLGLAANVAAVACLLVVATAHLSRGRRVLAALAALPVALVLGLVSSAAVGLVTPDDPGWVWAEINLWIVMAALLGVAVVVHARVGRRHRRPPHGAAGQRLRERAIS